MWRWVVVASAVVAAGATLYEKQLPFCDPDSTGNDLVIVSTLDGRLTAFSAESGVKAWDLKTEPLLSSNLHHVELTSGGKWVRLVPSLSGALYRLSGDSLEPLPLTAEQLLSSSFKYSEDLVVAGARQAAWAGVEARSGRVVYRCGAAGCQGGEDDSASDLLVLKHTAHTVRALDPRTGSEKWNLSVAEHHLSTRDGSACAAEPPGRALAVSLVLPDGVVAVSRDSSQLWQHKLNAPVADAWVLAGGRLARVDVLTAATATPSSLYIGVHEQQIYILEGQSSPRPSTALAPLPWRPRPARPLLPSGHETALAHLSDKDRAALALLTLYGKGAQSTGNHGYFLAGPATCDQPANVSDEDPPDEEPPELQHHVHVHVYSLWFWWKEVLLIAISSALLMNLMIWPRFFAPKFTQLPLTALPVDQVVVVERHPPPAASQPPPPPLPPPAEYVSRYATDFTPLRCLGRGGFGVVFECRNNIDHCSYAVKRITLPSRESKRQRMLREVRALAKLEHENIVRYFNAWLEEPPPDWQRRQDELWSRNLEGVSLSMTEDPTDKNTSTSPTNHFSHQTNNSVMLNLQKPQFDLSIDESLAKSHSVRNRSLSCNDSFSVVFSENGAANQTDDSFIVFADSGDVNHNSQGDGPADKRLEKVKQLDVTAEKGLSKKKGHRRHWSLDLCVASSGTAGGVAGSKMYLYIQMQLCRRDSLHAWLRQNRASASSHRYEQVIPLFAQIVSAVEYVHLAGLIHRDLKPSNIFFAPDGRVKVGDFGLVTTIADGSGGDSSAEFDPGVSHTHKVGTHLYMSPEQVRGAPYDYKVDIYSLGLVLFELLQPFGTESERVACLLRLRDGRFPDAFRERLPNETALLELMLSAEPATRPTAAGVRSRAPLCQHSDPRWHFTLPPRPPHPPPHHHPPPVLNNLLGEAAMCNSNDERGSTAND